MPAPTRYQTPHSQLRRLAEDARSRGESFEEFWVRAMRPRLPPSTVAWLEEDHPKHPPPEGAVLWPRDTTDRNQFIAAANWAKETWRACYEGAPVDRRVAALRILMPMLEGESVDPDELRAFASGAEVLSAA